MKQYYNDIYTDQPICRRTNHFAFIWLNVCHMYPLMTTLAYSEDKDKMINNAVYHQDLRFLQHLNTDIYISSGKVYMFFNKVLRFNILLL